VAAMGVSAAYARMLQTGQGQKVDTSLFEAAITQTYWQSAIAFATGVAPGPMGSAHPLNGPYQAFQTADGWINVGAANQRNWLRFLDVIGAPELNDDSRFASNHDRMQHLKQLEDILNDHLRHETSEVWLDRMERAGLPAGPVLDILQMQADPQAHARDMIVEVDHPVAGQVKTLGHPVKFSETPASIRRAAPTLGQHSREVLHEAGYAADQITTMIASGAVIAA